MKYIFLILTTLFIFTCTKNEVQDLKKLEETIYVRNDGADMPVYMRGNMSSKVVILIVHGGPGDGGIPYRNGSWTIDLEEKYAMAYWDQRGSSMSHGKYNKGDVNIAKMADDMKAVIQVLKAKYGEDVSVFAFAHSWGGMLSAKFLTTGNNQDLLNGWIDCDGAHDIPENCRELIKFFIQVSNEQINLGNKVEYWKGILDWSTFYDLTTITSKQFLEINEKSFEIQAKLVEEGNIAKQENGGNSFPITSGPINILTYFMSSSTITTFLDDELAKASITSELHKIDIPVLVLWGKNDFVVAPALGQDVYDKVSSTIKKIVFFEKSGHSPMGTEWRKFTDEILLFVDENK